MKLRAFLRPLIPAALAFAASAAPAIEPFESKELIIPDRGDISAMDYDPSKPVIFSEMQMLMLSIGLDYSRLRTGFNNGLAQMEESMSHMDFYAKNNRTYTLPEDLVERAAFFAAFTCMFDAADTRLANYETTWGVQIEQKREGIKRGVRTIIRLECAERFEATLATGFPLTPPTVTLESYDPGMPAAMKFTPFGSR